jgi:hypothetical protein
MADPDYTKLATSLLGVAGNLSAANQVAGGQNTLAQSQLALGQQAANAAQFRPVGVTSRFGTSGFQYDPAGNLIGAGYQVAPDVAAAREALLGYAGQNLTNIAGANTLQQSANTGAASLFNLGKNYIAETPATAAANWMKSQQQLLAPGQEQQLAQIQNQQFQLGRGGLAVGGTNQGYTTGPGAMGLAATNPQLAAYYNSLAGTNAGLAAQAQQQGMAQTTFGQGLMSGGLNLAGQGYGLQNTAYQPFNTALTSAATTEALGQNAYDLSTKTGAAQSTAGSNVAQILNAANTRAAATQQTGLTTQNTANTAATQGGLDAVALLLKSWSES